MTNGPHAWPARHRTRVGPAVLAMAITGSLLALLRPPAVVVEPPATRVAPVTVAVVLPPLALPAPAPAPAPAAVDASRTAPPSPRRAPSAEPVRRVDLGAPAMAADGAAPTAPQESLAPLSAAVPPAPGASQPQPLQLDLRPGAARAARGDFRGMADAAGAYAGDAAPSAERRLAEGVGQAGKADCIAAHAQGSLLSVFVIAYDAARGRCH